jgi:uncharacterized membrane-anchored protein
VYTDASLTFVQKVVGGAAAFALYKYSQKLNAEREEKQANLEGSKIDLNYIEIGN